MISDQYHPNAVAVKPAPLSFGNLDLAFDSTQDSPGLLMMSQDSTKHDLQAPLSPTTFDDFSEGMDMTDLGSVFDGTADEIHDAIADFLPQKQYNQMPSSLRALTPEPQPGFYGASDGSPMHLGTEPQAVAVQPNASASGAGAGLTPFRPKATKTSRVAGRDSTNTRARRSTTTRKAAVRTRTSNTPAKGTKRKRTKMPEAEQKRRNCESAKRSRLKKMQMLKEAQEKAARLTDENQALRKKFDDLRNWVIKFSLHVAGNHKECNDCTLMRSQQQLEQLLASPVTSPNAQLR